MKKFFAFVVAFAMVLSLVTVPAMAETKKAADPKLTGTAPAVTVRDAADLNEALNVEGGEIEFVSEGAYPWVVSGDAAMSGNGGVASSESVLTATVEAVDGDIVQFEFQAWGEGSYTFWDHCDFYINGVQQFTYGAYDNDWETFAAALTEGENTLTWSYTKDSSVNPTGDYFMVDNVYVGQPVQPNAIEVEDITVPAGRHATVQFTVLPAEAFDKTATFAIADTSIATVDANGVVTGVAEGETTITVTSVANPEVSGEATVTVTEALPTVWLYGFDTYDMAGSYDNMWIQFPDYDPTDYMGCASMSGNAWAAAFAGGNVYGYLYDGDNASYPFFIMDAETFDVAYPGTGAENVSGILGMSYNYANDTMYGISGGDTRELCTIDLATGVPTPVAPISGMDSPLTFAIDMDGVAYAIEYQTGALYTIDLETGAATFVGSTGVAAAYVQSMCFDYDTNQLFWAQISSGDDHGLYVINTDTAEATFMGLIGPSGGEITGLYTMNDIEIAPIEMPDVTVTFVDGYDNTVLGEMTVEAGYVLVESDFPEVPTHPGLEFTGWDYNGAGIYTDTTITARFYDPNSIIWDFETDPEAQGFEFVDQDGDGYNWMWKFGSEWSSFNFHEGEGFATSQSYDNNYGVLYPDNWMITPEFHGRAISFWAQGQDPSYAAEYLGVFVSTDGGATWSDEIMGITTGANDTEYTVDLSDYAGTNIKVAIRHYNISDMYWVNVDYITVTPDGETPVEPTIIGDVDGDGEVTIADALLVLRYCMGVQDLNDAQLAVADINGDGEVTLDDAILLLRLAMGLITLD